LKIHGRYTIGRFVKGPFGLIFGIPAKAGIQLIHLVLDSCSRLSLGQASQE
jgi:hypothetical protein